MAAKPKLLTKTAYAAHRGVNPSQITRYLARGMPQHVGMIEPTEADEWCERSLDPTKPKSKVTPEQRAQPVAPSVVHRPNPPRRRRESSADTPDLNAARAWDTHWSAERRRQQVDEFDRTHIALAEVEAFADLLNTTYWQGLEAVAGRTASAVAAVCGGDVAIIGEIIRDEHRALRAAVAREFGRLADLGKGSGAVAPDAGGDDSATEAMDGRMGGGERYPAAEVSGAGPVSA